MQEYILLHKKVKNRCYTKAFDSAVHHKIVEMCSLNPALATSIYRDTNISCKITCVLHNSCVILMRIVLTETC